MDPLTQREAKREKSWKVQFWPEDGRRNCWLFDLEAKKGKFGFSDRKAENRICYFLAGRRKRIFLAGPRAEKKVLSD